MHYLIAVFVVLFSVLCASPLQVDISAKAAILINANTGTVLFEKFPDLSFWPANTTKIATALYALESEGEDLQRETTVSTECLKRKLPGSYEGVAWWLDSDAPVIGLKRGEKFPLVTLLEGMLVTSGNDAANALAEGISGDIGTFMHHLNEYLVSIGCKATHFCNPHGLHHEEHISTARDLALITRKAMQRADFCKVVSQVSWTRPATNQQPQQDFSQTNRLLRPGRFFYEKAIGTKTGYHARAGYHLVASAEQEGRRLIAVVLGCETSDDRYHDTKRLFETAFGEKKVRRTLFSGQECYSCQIEGAKTALRAILAAETAIEYFPSEEIEVAAKILWDIPHLPIYKGQKVGEIRITDAQNIVVQSTPLLAQEEVKGTLLFVLKDKLSQIINCF